MLISSVPLRLRPLHRPLVLVTVFALGAASAAGVAESPANAAGLVNNMLFLMSSNQVDATNVTYTVEFTTATAATIGSVRLAVAAGGSSAGLGNVYGLGAGTVTAGKDGLVYTIAAPVLVPAGTPIYIEFTGLTNHSELGARITAALVTMSNDSQPTVVDSGLGEPITMGEGNTAASLQIAETFTVTNDTVSYAVSLNPAVAALTRSSKSVSLSVKTNAGRGYVVSMSDTGMVTGGHGAAVPPDTASPASLVTSTGFVPESFVAAARLSTPANSQAMLGSGFSGSRMSAYGTVKTTLVTATKPTGNTADIITVVNQAIVGRTSVGGIYEDTIFYTVSPFY